MDYTLPSTSNPQTRRPALSGLLAGVFLGISLVLGGCSGSPPQSVGPVGDDLRPCPGTPNCVHTGRGEPSDAPDFRLAPEWREGGAREEVLDRVAEALASLPRTQVVDRRGDYLRAEATSRIFRFVDDVEVLLDPEGERLVVRSASRMGQSDLGVNLDRVRELHGILTREGILTDPLRP